MPWASFAQSIDIEQQQALVEQAVHSLQGIPLETIRDRSKLTSQALRSSLYTTVLHQDSRGCALASTPSLLRR